MSARRRQETIARFSVPVKHDTPTVVSTKSSTSVTRRRGRTSRAVDADLVVSDNEDDTDYVAADNDDGDDEFVDDDDKPKGKGKKEAKAFDDLYFTRSGSSSADVNPKVMLISLKAGALGLNLTVANNVYL